MRNSLLLALTVVISASAADAPTGLTAPLQPLAFWVGHCWEGKFADGRSTDKHCFEPMLGGQFVRDRHVVRGDQPDYSGETIYWLDPATKQISYMYFNSQGGVSKGTVQVQGARLQFPGEEYTGADGKVQRYRTSWERVGAGGYVALTEQESSGNWVEAWRVHFSRVADN
ncbi:MAG TPA: hypothetical protein VH542_12530 [Steroidobacteraceae bacterium]|jgi:hypothetical protein